MAVLREELADSGKSIGTIEIREKGIDIRTFAGG